MQEYFDYVQRGFRILLPSMSGYLGRTLLRTYGADWWKEVLNTLHNQYDLPTQGSYEELVDSLDIANCIRLLDWKWGDTFRPLLSLNCRVWARELMGVRNVVAHIGNQDLEQPEAERALNTMYLLCRELDEAGAAELYEIYTQVRAKADTPKAGTGLEQPESASSRGKLTEGSLLQLVGTDQVRKTNLTRKVTFGKKTVVYPVYEISLGLLFYNDRNDRIATWISRYEAENGVDSLKELQPETYNRIVENFVYDSNPESIHKTQNNIDLVGQREPGVTLADGRVVDGNRRLTCLRRLQREKKAPMYFETVIMDMDLEADQKQIKLLELAIQHGEEKKVDYDQIDYAIGTYRDIVQTGLLTVEEYAASTNEPQGEVRKRLEAAGLITEFLAYIHLPEQYYAAREYQVYDLFKEMLPVLKQLNEQAQQELKTIVFDNAVLKGIPDQRSFIRKLKSLVKEKTYETYFEEQKPIHEAFAAKLAEKPVHKKEDLDAISQENHLLADKMQTTMERALQHSRNQQLKARPAENVNKAMGLLLDIDPRLFGKLEPDDRSSLEVGLDELIRLAEKLKNQL